MALAARKILSLHDSPRRKGHSGQELTRRMLERRAVEAAIWGMPAVNYDLMLQEMLLHTAGKVNQMIYWGRPLDWKNQTLTPNPDTLYFMSFLNTRNVGPIVIEIPAAGPQGSLNANIVNIWQQPLEDAGLLGIDKGKGAKLLMLPPGYAGPVPDDCEALQPNTHGSYALFRSNLASHGETDVAKSVSYAKQTRIYPLAQGDNPPPLVFTDVSETLFDSTIRYDEGFFDHLNRIVQNEPWLDRDRHMIDQLKSLGIEKGKLFLPDMVTRQALAAGIPGQECQPRQPCLQRGRHEKRRGWIGRALCRTQSTGWGRQQLDSDRPVAKIRADVQALRAQRGILPETLDIAGRGSALPSVKRPPGSPKVSISGGIACTDQKSG